MEAGVVAGGAAGGVWNGVRWVVGVGTANVGRVGVPEGICQLSSN